MLFCVFFFFFFISLLQTGARWLRADICCLCNFETNIAFSPNTIWEFSVYCRRESEQLLNSQDTKNPPLQKKSLFLMWWRKSLFVAWAQNKKSNLKHTFCSDLFCHPQNERPPPSGCELCSADSWWSVCVCVCVCVCV